MTSTVKRVEGELHSITITCDQIDCDLALNDKQIEAGDGLKEMGWQAMFIAPAMRHYCPAHNRARP